jgi:hypothetical protein
MVAKAERSVLEKITGISRFQPASTLLNLKFTFEEKPGRVSRPSLLFV